MGDSLLANEYLTAPNTENEVTLNINNDASRRQRSFQVQMKLMMRKNYLMKRRAPCVTCCEIVSPVIVLMLFASIGLAVKSEYSYDNELFLPAGMRDASAASAWTAIAEAGGRPGSAGHPLQEFKPAMGTLLFAADDDKQTQAEQLCNLILPTLQREYAPIYQETRYLYSWPVMTQKCSDPDTIQKSGAALDEYAVKQALEVKGETHVPVWAGVVLNSLSQDGKEWDYTLRFNSTATPSTKTFTASLTVAPDTKWQQYFTSGYINLQAITEQAILNITATATGKISPQLRPSFKLMPWQSFTINYYTQGLLTGTFPIIFGLIFAVSFFKLTQGIVMEKEKRIKEGMLMMVRATNNYFCFRLYLLKTLIKT